MKKPSLCVIVESGIDVRLVEELATAYNLEVLARKKVLGKEISQEPKVRVNLKLGPCSRSKFAFFVLKYLLKKRGEFDFIIVQNYGMPALATNLASRLTGVPSAMLVCSPTELYYLCRKKTNEKELPFRWYELMAIKLLARMNAIIGRQYIVLSEFLKKVVEGHGTRRPIRIIPIYGVDANIFAPTKEPKTKLRHNLSLPEKGKIVFFSSRIAPEKDTITLLRAIKYLRGKGRNIYLLNRSGGYKSLLRYAIEINIRDSVIAAEAVHPYKELPEIYNACDLCVQASVEEGLGFSALEALCCEIPVIASQVGGLKETIINEKTGWTYLPGNARMLAKRIETVLDNPKEGKIRAKEGRKLVLARYEKRKVFRELQKLIKQNLDQLRFIENPLCGV